MDINPTSPGSTEGPMPEPEAPVQNSNETTPEMHDAQPRPMGPDVTPPAPAPAGTEAAPVAPEAPQPVVFRPDQNQGSTGAQPAAPASPAPSMGTESPMTAAPMQPGGPVTGAVSSGAVDVPAGFNNKNRNLKKLLVPIVAAVVVLGAGAAVYAGYYLPNKPENMWHSALVNSGKGYDKLTQYATTNKHAKGWSETGSFKFTGPFVADGAVNGKSDGQTGDFSGSLSATGLKLGLDVRSFPSTGDTPDIYFKLDGLQGLGDLLGGFGADPSVGTALNGLNGQWYVVDHTLFEQYLKGSNANMQVTSDDISSILNAVGKASKQYVFTADDKKAVVVVKQQIGKEKQGNRSVYHYKVGVNKQNLKLYVDALCNDLQASRLSKLLPSGENVQDTLGCADIRKSVDNLKDGDTADAWVDTHTKLIHDIRFYDKTNKDNYFDIGQDYQGGNSFPFVLSSHSKDGDTTTDLGTKLTLDTKANSLKIEGQFITSGSDGENGSITLTVSPNNQPVKVDKPANAKTIIELANDLGLGGLFGGADTSTPASTGGSTSVQSKARDSKRQTDMQALQTQLEAFFAENGYYPSLTDMNSASWRATNMRSLDSSALQDPQGTSQTLAKAPAAKVYSYAVSNSSGNSCEADDTTCAQYDLTATLESGGTYTKSNLD